MLQQQQQQQQHGRGGAVMVWGPAIIVTEMGLGLSKV